MASPPTLTVISLGGGVRSSVMALMANAKAFEGIPNCAIFADTHWEPPSIYSHLDWLAQHLSFPMYMVDNGRSLREDAKALTNHSGNHRFVDLPVCLKRRDREANGIGRRPVHHQLQDTPIHKKIRELLDLSRGQRVPSGTTIELWLGISTDEAIPRPVDTQPLPPHRGGQSLRECPEWWTARHHRPLERSACVGCLFQSPNRWVETKRRCPELFAEAVQIDANMRKGLAFAQEPYLHPLRVPLNQAVSRDEAQLGHHGEGDGFGNECEGHCGV